jgi:choice-of-anchor C domain-containing protein
MAATLARRTIAHVWIGWVAVLLLFALGPRAVCAIGLIENGGFELPDVPGRGFVTFNAGSGGIPHWSIVRDNIDVVEAFVGPAFEGEQYIDLNGTVSGVSNSTAGIVQQAFETVPGQVYTLSFWYADNHRAGESIKNAEVTAFDATTNAPLFPTIEFSHGTSTQEDLRWTPLRRRFTAASGSSLLRFTSREPDNNNGILLDAVDVQMVPEPPAAMLLAIAAVLAGAGRYRCMVR